jgi:hypothetical protein
MKNILKAVLAISLTSFFTPRAAAQTVLSAPNHCGTEVPGMEWENEFQRLIKARQSDNAGNRAQAALYTIPVIIHVIHGGQAVGNYPNLPQAQLVSQIQALNNDFAGAGFNSGNYPINAFSNWALSQNINASSLDPSGSVKIADCQVQFCLALYDTLGNLLPEPGIDRVNYVSKGWSNPGGISNYNTFKNYMDNTIKPGTIWNVSRYMNIWVTDSDVGNVNLLGYATFPPLAGLSGLGSSFGTATTDGFWCYAKCFGSASTYTPNVYYNGYNRGRTSTHEIGHWLGLRHIWGDGNCSATDFCADTPPASSSNFGAPTYPYKTNICSGNSPDGEMFMNFMDYTNDPVKYMFTTDQAARVQTAMQNSPYRKFLGTHNLCSVIYEASSAAFNNVISTCTGVGLKLTNITTGFPPSSYTWSAAGGGAATFVPSNSATSPSISFSSPGIYTITLAADNGTLSTTTKTINVTSPQLLLTASPQQTVCAGQSVTLSASGVSTFTWEPNGVVWYEITETPQLPVQVYTCNATEVNGCTTTGTIALYVSICTGVNAPQAEPLAFSVHPNPATDWLSVNNGRRSATEVTVTISDALGRLVLSDQLSFSKNMQEHRLNVASLEKGIYLVKLKSAEGQQQVMKFIKE